MSQVNNLDALTEKVYREGIEKAEIDAREIRAKAEEERRRILDEARQQAEKTVTEAKREAERITRMVENELQLKGKRLISDLQSRLHTTIAEKSLVQPTAEAFKDEKFMQSAILEAISSWDPNGLLEIRLPKSLEQKLSASFDKEVRKRAKNLTIVFDGALETGFRLSEKGKGYQISFSEEDFITLFMSYLQEQTRKIIFSDSK